MVREGADEWEEAEARSVGSARSVCEDEKAWANQPERRPGRSLQLQVKFVSESPGGGKRARVLNTPSYDRFAFTSACTYRSQN